MAQDLSKAIEIIPSKYKKIDYIGLHPAYLLKVLMKH